MPLTLTWLGRDALERIADVRLRCYGNSPADRASFFDRTRRDRLRDGDVLVVSDDTGDVATATSLSLRINVRGTPLPCQGVAWVGTVRSHRRRKIDGSGLATTVMRALEAKARERGEAYSLLAPFRVSFYEAFGYGVVERQNVWTIPLAAMPEGDTAGFRDAAPADFDAMLATRDRQFRQTHGDVATDAVGLRHWLDTLEPQGFRLLEQQGDAVASHFTLATEIEHGRGIANVLKPFWDSPAALKRLLAMLGTLKDQYSAARIHLPADLPVNWWLRERQVPHRRVDHPAPACRTISRMQGRALDVPAVVAALRPTTREAGVVTVGVRGRVPQTWRIETADGRALATAATGEPDLSLDAPVWAGVLAGELKPRTAAELGLLDLARPAALDTLAAVVDGPAPYCHEYF